MNTSFKNYLLATLTAKSGRIASFVAGVMVAALVRFAAHHGLAIPPEILNEVTVATPFFVSWVIDFVVLHINAAGVKQIQETLQNAPTVTQEVKVDGVPGASTQNAVNEATGTEPPVG